MNTTAARKGRERTCNQCGAVYRSPRTSLFCSNACRLKAKRGTAPTGGPKAGPESFSPITKALYLTGYVGRLGSQNQPIYALVVDPNEAYAELAYQFDRKGWGIVSRDEFDSDLKANGIHGFNTRSGQAADLNRRQTRRRMERLRA